MAHKTDIEIAREATKRPIQEIGAKLGIPSEDLLPFGHDKAKVSDAFIKAQSGKADGKLILVTAINPTPAGEGKTTDRSHAFGHERGCSRAAGSSPAAHPP
ncbi:MAG: formate--tetrahydrofolate ligase, partial [Pseudomonadota bacterium]